MKTIKLILLLLPFVTLSQSQLSINIYQDARLATFGDNKGNEAFTSNFRIRNEWQAGQLNHSYWFVAPEFEYADLQLAYKRYSVNVGQRFNKFSKLFQASYSLGYGITDRSHAKYTSFNADAELSVVISSNIHLLLSSQLTQRKELQQFVMYSGFIGVKYNFN